MHISHIQGVVAFVSTMNKETPVKSVCRGPADAPSEAGLGNLRDASSHQSTGHWTEVSEAFSQSLTEVSAQSGRAVVHSELDEGVQEVSVQIGELLP